MPDVRIIPASGSLQFTGSSAADSIHVQYTNSGLNFTSGSTNLMIVSSSGNVGIRTSTPKYLLTNTNSTSPTGYNGFHTLSSTGLYWKSTLSENDKYVAVFENTNSYGDGVLIKGSSTSHSLFELIDASANKIFYIGDSTVSSTWGAFSATTSILNIGNCYTGAGYGRISVGGTSAVQGLETFIFSNSASERAITFRNNNTGQLAAISALTDDLNFYTRTSGTFTSSDIRMRIAPTTGNVLINTTTDAGYKLDVNGNVRIKATGTTSATTALLVQNANASASLQVLDNNKVIIGSETVSQGSLYIGHNGTSGGSNGTSTVFFASQFASNYAYRLGAEGNGYDFYLRQVNNGQGSINIDFSGLNRITYNITNTNILNQSFTTSSIIVTKSSFNSYLAIGNIAGVNNSQTEGDTPLILFRSMTGGNYDKTLDAALTIRNGAPTDVNNNIFQNTAYWYRNGYIGIGTSTTLSSINNLKGALTINQGTKTGFRNTNSAVSSSVITSGTSTTVSFTPDNGNGVIGYNIVIGSVITANGVSRRVTALAYNNVTVDTAVDWSAGHNYTYRNPYVSIADGSIPIFDINPSGNVGIGTSTPNAKLDISGSAIITGSLTVTGGITGSITSASFASTASFVNTLNQSVIVTSSMVIGSSSLGPSENTLTLGARDAGGEGGQLGLNASGGTYTSASMLDNYQNQFRILRGSNAGSDALVASWNMHTKQMQLPAYNSVSAFAGTAAANLAVDSSGNVITVSTSGGTVFPYAGNAVITGSLTTTGIIYAQPNGGMYFQGGDDAALYDINVVNTMGIYGVQDATVGSIKLGSGGGTISGKSGNIGIGTINPTSASFQVNGNVWATSFTGSHFGTSSYATQALSASWAPGGGGSSFPYTGSARITGSLNVIGDTVMTGSLIVSNSLDTSNRNLYTPLNNTALDWSDDTILNSNVYQRDFKSTTTQNTVSNTINNAYVSYLGDIIEVDGTYTFIDSGVTDGMLVYLDTDATWYPVSQSSTTATKMIGIAFNVTGGGLNTGFVLLEGHVVINVTLVQSPDHGLPVYIRDNTTTGEMSTVVPTTTGGTQVIRVLGHCYWNNIGDPTQWMMKFRPSNDWILI